MAIVEIEKSGYLAHVRLNRPEKLNAVNPAMVDALEARLDDIESDDSIRVVLFSGEGRAFSAGFDINATEVRDGESKAIAIRRELERAFEIILRIWDCNKPTIAAVHGYCLGSSMELSAVCDLTVASNDCKFGAPEVTFGSGIVCLILPWIVGVKNANEILLLGRKDMSASRAKQIGLVNKVVNEDSLMAEARRFARELAMNDVQAVAATRSAIRQTLDGAGLRESLRRAFEADIRVETNPSAESTEFFRIMEADGLHAALDWRETILDKAN